MEKRSVGYYTGCLLGGAVGDALGAPVEFMTISEIRRRYGAAGITGYVEYVSGDGEFTDDTQMTLFTAEALLRARHRAQLKGIGGALSEIAHQSYLRWLSTQGFKTSQKKIDNSWLVQRHELYRRRAPGTTCLQALSSGIAGTIDRPINDSKGCGTIMRSAPVGLSFFGNPGLAFKFACELAALTHGHSTGYLSAGFFASMISGLAVGASLERSVRDSVKILKKWKCHEETLMAVEKAIALFKSARKIGKADPEALETLGGGWVAEEALSISIFTSLLFEKDFRKGVLYAVNHGGDSDSSGAITGNILGLINRIGEIPGMWIEHLKGNQLVKEVAEDLFTGVKGDSFNMNEAWWEKYPGY